MQVAGLAAPESAQLSELAMRLEPYDAVVRSSVQGAMQDSLMMTFPLHKWSSSHMFSGCMWPTLAAEPPLHETGSGALALAAGTGQQTQPSNKRAWRRARFGWGGERASRGDSCARNQTTPIHCARVLTRVAAAETRRRTTPRRGRRGRTGGSRRPSGFQSRSWSA